MTVNGPKSDAGEDHISLSSVDIEDRKHNSGRATPVAKVTQPKTSETNRNALSVPYSAPTRSLLPDTISNLSVNEYQQLQASGESRNDSRLSLRAAESRGWRGKIDQFWVRNKGLAFMLLAQLFGVL